MSELTDLSRKQAGADKTTEKRGLITILKKEWQLLTKIFELVLCITCIALVMEPAKRGDLPKIHLDHFALIFTTFIGYSLITSIFIVTKIIGDKLPYRTGFMFAVLASSLFFISGILLAMDRRKKYFHDGMFYEPRPHLLNLLLAASALSFFSSLVFAVEGRYIWKFMENF